VTTVARSLRGLLPVLAASATVAAVAVPAAAASSAAGQPVTRAGQWWLTALHLPATPRAAPAAGKGVTVAVLSTGVDAGHPDLAGSVTTGPDYSDTGREASRPYWGEEGTAVASLIAGHGHGPGGIEGITGVAPGARILSVQVTLEYDDPLNSDAAVTGHLPAAIAAGIRYAVGHGATVIALPLDPGTLQLAPAGDPAAGGSAAERAAVSYALDHNVLLVAPAGDNGAETNSVNYPAAYPGVIAVGATARSGQLAPFSGARSYVALTAPGSGDTPDFPGSGGTQSDSADGLTVAAADGGYQSLASTDMSAALTAGVAALIRSRYPRLTVTQVAQSLERGATAASDPADHPASAGWGHGELDAGTALTAAAATAAAHPAPAPSASPSASPATRMAVSSPVPRPAAPRPDPGGQLLRSLAVDLAAAAGVLIACLIGAITVSRLRRRGRQARGASRARHARGQPEETAAREQPQAIPTWEQPQATSVWQQPQATSVWEQQEAPVAPAALTAAWHPQPAAPAESAESAGWQWTGEQTGWQWIDEPAGRPETDEQAAGQSIGAQPPWQPARAPGHRASPEDFLPAEPEVPEAVTRPPWEQPEAPSSGPLPRNDTAGWRVSNTGPIYVWNPAATTGPLGILGGADAAGGADDPGDDASEGERD
jgi:subtilisin family serine protease